MSQDSSVASLSYPIQSSALRIGDYVMIQEFPCRIIEMSISKTGKHGSAKINLTGIDIFNGNKHKTIEKSTSNVDVPNVTKMEYQLIDITRDNFLSLMDANGVLKEDIKLVEGELCENIRNEFDDGKELSITIQSAMNQESIIAYKIIKN